MATVGAVLVGTLVGFSSRASAQQFDEIYVFGDSLSDVGKVFQASEGKDPPSPPYFQGHYSNGPVWVEYLASKLKLPSNPNTNFAFSGATTGDSREIPLGLLVQIENFTTTHSSADPNALYIVWAGANDYLRGATDTTKPIHNINRAVKLLSAVGAKNIVVVNLPDLGNLPSTRTGQDSELLTDLTEKHNSELATSLKSLYQQLSFDTRITYLDVNSLFNQVIKTPEKFGFVNVTRPCLSKGSICAEPDKYLFWDGIHPTTAAHKLFVGLAFSTLKPVPAAPLVSAPILTLALSVFVFSVSAGLALNRKNTAVQRNR